MSGPVMERCEVCGKKYVWIDGTIESCPWCKEGNIYTERVWVGREFHIDAAHFIPHHEKCGFVHGHTWHITVEVFGRPESSGMLIDLNRLKELVNQELEIYDHQMMNEKPAFKTYPPTCENLATLLVSRVGIKLSAGGHYNIDKIRVKVQEGEGGWAIAQS